MTSKRKEAAGAKVPCSHPGCDRSFDTERGAATHRRVHQNETPPAPEVPEPPRPLRLAGLEMWRLVHRQGAPSGVLEAFLTLCEQMDERSALRLRVIQHSDPKDRSCLRALEDQIGRGLRELGLVPILPQPDDGGAIDWTADG